MCVPARVGPSTGLNSLMITNLKWGYIRNAQNQNQQLRFYHRLNLCYRDIPWPPILYRLCRFATSTTVDDVGIATLKQEIIYSYKKVNIIRIMDQRGPLNQAIRCPMKRLYFEPPVMDSFIDLFCIAMSLVNKM